MRLAQAAPYVTYPPRLGGDHRTHGLVKEFPEFGDTVERFCQGGSPAMYKSLDLRREVEIADGYTEHRHLHPIHELLKAPMLLGYPNVFQSGALRLANDGLGRMLDEADVVLVREPWQTEYVFNHVDETPVVFSSHNVETERFGDIDQPIFAEWFEDYVDRLEQQSVQGADAVVCTSKRDAEVYRKKYDPGGPILIAPNGTYEDDLRGHYPDSDEAKRIRDRYDITESTVCLFMGSNYRPNVEAVKAICDIAVETSDWTSPVHFLVLGSVGKALDGNQIPENVTMTGYVKEDFEGHFDAADIALNPMQSGGGTNIKLIDYFARSLPVISTPFGVRGMDVREAEDIIITELDEFATAIDTLRNKPKQQQKIGTAGRQLAERKYTWESASQHLRERIYDLFGPF